MEGTPGNIDLDEVRSALLAIPHVSGVHDLHVWMITSGFVALSAHLTCLDPTENETILRAARAALERFGIQHSTIQVDRDPSCTDASDAGSPG